jgi:hypothetical protein
MERKDNLVIFSWICGTYTVEECRTGIPSELEGGRRENRDKRTRKILEYIQMLAVAHTCSLSRYGELSG